jgi:Fe2+ transport system protein FeoA
MTLDSLRPGDEAVILSVEGEEGDRLRGRVFALGFVPGSVVKVVRRAPLADPTEYEVRGGRVSLRRSEARLIAVSA